MQEPAVFTQFISFNPHSTPCRVCLPPFFARLARSGAPIYQKKIGTSFEEDTVVALSDADGFFGLAEAKINNEGERVLRSLRLFRI